MPTFKDNALCPIIIIYKTSCICNYENGFNSPSGDDNLFDFKEIYIIKKINIVFCYFLKKKKKLWLHILYSITKSSPITLL